MNSTHVHLCSKAYSSTCQRSGCETSAELVRQTLHGRRHLIRTLLLLHRVERVPKLAASRCRLRLPTPALHNVRYWARVLLLFRKVPYLRREVLRIRACNTTEERGDGLAPIVVPQHERAPSAGPLAHAVFPRFVAALANDREAAQSRREQRLGGDILRQVVRDCKVRGCPRPAHEGLASIARRRHACICTLGLSPVCRGRRRDWGVHFHHDRRSHSWRVVRRQSNAVCGAGGHMNRGLSRRVAARSATGCLRRSTLLLGRRSGDGFRWPIQARRGCRRGGGPRPVPTNIVPFLVPLRRNGQLITLCEKFVHLLRPIGERQGRDMFLDDFPKPRW